MTARRWITEDLGISLHAATGIDVADTMRLQVKIGESTLTALVDTGSTHTFIRDSVAAQLGLALSPRPGLLVKVANGDCIACPGVCSNTSLSIGDDRFMVDCYSLPLGAFDIVLGVSWLRTLGPILWDFSHLTMSLWINGRTVNWTGVGASPPVCSAISVRRDLLEALLVTFEDIFADPCRLPPARRHDHNIHLLPGTAPITVQLYRYPQLLKDEVERQCDEM